MQLIESEINTAAGVGKNALWSALVEGRDCSRVSNEVSWAKSLSIQARLCLIDDDLFFRQRWEKYLTELWTKIYNRLPTKTATELQGAKVGIIFSSTKGMLEDFIREPTENINNDPFWPIIKDFKEKVLAGQNIRPARSLCISHACSSTHVSLEHADFWLRNKICDYVILVAGDLVGPFVFRGFQSLKILSGTKCQPFSAKRDGLQLGETCSTMLLTRDENLDVENEGICIRAVQSESEGASVTRPSMDGSSLFRAIEKLEMSKMPDLIIAHGTGTKFNDAAEDKAFQKMSQCPPVTGCKWAVGHTLGGSGAVDILAGSMILRNQQVFRIHNSSADDPDVKSPVLYHQSQNLPNKFNSILISSLGFGGIHGALLLEKTGVI